MSPEYLLKGYSCKICLRSHKSNMYIKGLLTYVSNISRLSWSRMSESCAISRWNSSGLSQLAGRGMATVRTDSSGVTSVSPPHGLIHGGGLSDDVDSPRDDDASARARDKSWLNDNVSACVKEASNSSGRQTDKRGPTMKQYLSMCQGGK